jgi:hypothetical protein
MARQQGGNLRKSGQESIAQSILMRLQATRTSKLQCDLGRTCVPPGSCYELSNKDRRGFQFQDHQQLELCKGKGENRSDVIVSKKKAVFRPELTYS